MLKTLLPNYWTVNCCSHTMALWSSVAFLNQLYLEYNMSLFPREFGGTIFFSFTNIVEIRFIKEMHTFRCWTPGSTCGKMLRGELGQRVQYGQCEPITQWAASPGTNSPHTGEQQTQAGWPSHCDSTQPLPSVWVSWSCHNKFPLTWWL